MIASFLRPSPRPSAACVRHLCHLCTSSSTNSFLFPSVPCKRSPTYSTISSTLSMERMYLGKKQNKHFIDLHSAQFFSPQRPIQNNISVWILDAQISPSQTPKNLLSHLFLLIITYISYTFHIKHYINVFHMVILNRYVVLWD